MELIKLTGEFQKSVSINKNFRGGNSSLNLTIPKDAPNLIEFCSNIPTRLGTAGCARLLNEENPKKCDLFIKTTTMINNYVF